jgi:predicted phosphodiesterase
MLKEEIMKIALISDIHSNLFAFDAVLKDLSLQSVDLTIFLGDLVYGGIYPRECLSKLMNISPLITIKGNADGRFDDFDDKGNKFKKDNRNEIHCWVKDKMTESDIATIKGTNEYKNI